MFDRLTRQYVLMVDVDNNGNDLPGQLRLVVESANKTAVGADGTTAAGEPFYALLTANDAVFPGGTTLEQPMRFVGGRGQLVATLRLENQPPAPAAAPEIEVARSGDASQVFVGDTATFTITVTNTGSDVLDVDDVAASGEPFIVFPPTRFNVAPGGARNVFADFAPTAPGNFGGTVTITSNAVNQDPVVGIVAFNGIDACALADDVLTMEVLLGSFDAYPGTPAVKNTSSLPSPVLDPVPSITTIPELEICGAARENTTVRVAGGAAVVQAQLGPGETDFCVTVPLQRNTQNILIATAIDNLGPAPRALASAAPVEVIHVDVSEFVIAQVDARPLSENEIVELVEQGIIELDDPTNFNVSIFTLVFTVGGLPVTVTQPVVIPAAPPAGGNPGIGGGFTLGTGFGGSGAWVGAPVPAAPGDPPPPVQPPSAGGCTNGCAVVVAVPTPSGEVIPGVIIIEGRIKTLKEFFLSPNASYRVTLIGASAGGTNAGTAICNAQNASPMEQTLQFSFTTAQDCAFTLPPTVILLEPADGSVDNALNQNIVLQFDNQMNPSTFQFVPGDLAASTFGVFEDAVVNGDIINEGTPVSGAASFSQRGTVLSYDPLGNYSPDSTIIVRLNGVADVCGNPLQNSPVLLSFDTQPTDLTPPDQPLVNPVPVLTGLPAIQVTGTAEPLSTVTVSGGTSDATSQASASGLFSVSVPLAPDASSSLSVVAVDASANTSAPTVTTDLNGVALTVVNDSTPPAVLALDPPAGATDVARDTGVVVIFDEPVDAGTINGFNFSLENRGPVSGTLSLDGDTGLRFTPDGLLDFDTQYTISLRAGGVGDLASNNLASDLAFTFTIEPFPAPILTAVTPADGLQGTTFPATFTGINLSTANTVISDNGAITGSIQTATGTTVTADITISPTSPTGLTTLGLATDGGSASLPFTVMQRPPVISALTPDTALPGQTVAAQIAGEAL